MQIEDTKPFEEEKLGLKLLISARKSTQEAVTHLRNFLKLAPEGRELDIVIKAGLLLRQVQDLIDSSLENSAK